MTPKAQPKPKVVKDKYFEARGARKTATARARLWQKKGGITVNDKDYKDYFRVQEFQKKVAAPFSLLGMENLSATVKVKGGGLAAQADAVLHALARTLVAMDDSYKVKLRHAGFLTRDSRMVERKKYGLKKARRAPQWAKR